jgi:hypothetical protein
MKKALCFLLLFSIIQSILYAQDEEYVIDQPKSKIDKFINKTENPDFTNYSLTASAYTLDKKDFRLATTDIIFTKLSYGISNNTMASVNISLIGTFVGALKHQFHVSDNLKLGMSCSGGQIYDVGEDTVVNFLGGQTMITLGDIQDNITIGTGIYYANSNQAIINREKEFLLSNVYASTQKQIGRKTYLMAEAIYFWNYKVISGALAFKFIIKTKMSLIAGIMPIYWNGNSAARIESQTSSIPLISFRMLLNKD